MKEHAEKDPAHLRESALSHKQLLKKVLRLSKQSEDQDHRVCKILSLGAWYHISDGNILEI
jgi:hypothetical protein